MTDRKFVTGQFRKMWASALIAMVGGLAILWCVHWSTASPLMGRADPQAPILTIRVDGNGTGRIFDGVGGLSAGAASRFLIDYPEPYQSQMLDYLFKPHYGASLQDLKVEIGGDTNSTWGSEPSHMHSRDDANFTRGYEWWLMREARKRNPKIVIEILPWGVPGWVGNYHFYSLDMIDYDLKFINAAHDVHGIDIDYLGIWNEIRYDKEWIKSLKSALVRNNAAHHLQTRIVAADSVHEGWQLADDMTADRALLKAVDAVGVHYPVYESTPAARNLMHGNTYVPLWDSEDTYLIYPGPPAGVLAKQLNRNYILGKMTRLVHCTLAAAFPAFFPYKEGLIQATSPWSGHYEISPALWAIAHTTQFAQPGWQYLDSASGLFQDDAGKTVGSYVTLKAPNRSDYSIIIETADATTSQQVNLLVSSGLSSNPVHVWHSNIKAGTYFVRESELPGGANALNLQPGSIYSLTTTTGQQKGNPGTPPADAPFPLPYADNFEREVPGQPARYFADQEGSFEVASCTGRPGKCLRQTVDQPPIKWGGGLNKIYYPFTFLGDQVGSQSWTDYEVGLDVMMEGYGSVTLWGRLDHLIPCLENGFDCLDIQSVPDGYAINVDSEGRWMLNKSFDKGATVTKIKSGVIMGWRPRMWHHLKMAFKGSSISVFIDGKPVIDNHVDTGKTHGHGMVALGTEWNKAQFDNFCLDASCP
jgi:hypothetical protein